MITASVSEARRNLGLLIEQARKGEQFLIIKDSRPVATIQPFDASDLELAPRITNDGRGPAKSFRSAASAARFLKKDIAGRVEVPLP